MRTYTVRTFQALAILALVAPLAACDLGLIFEGIFGPF